MPLGKSSAIYITNWSERLAKTRFDVTYGIRKYKLFVEPIRLDCCNFFPLKIKNIINVPYSIKVFS